MNSDKIDELCGGDSRGNQLAGVVEQNIDSLNKIEFREKTERKNT